MKPSILLKLFLPLSLCLLSCIVPAHSSTSTVNRKVKSPSSNKENEMEIPVAVYADKNTAVLGIGEGEPIPLGVPFEIDSPIFKGKVLLRFRNAASGDVPSHENYFKGRKRLMQTVLQGQFKKPTKMSDVYVGSIFDKPLAQAPPPTLTRIMDAIIRRVAPGVVLDLASEEPRVIALYAGTAQTLSMDKPGSQPNMADCHLPENVKLSFADKVKLLSSAHKRKKYLSSPHKAAKYEFDTEHVYTFHSYDDAMDYGRGTMHIPMYGEYDLKPAIGQPLSLTAVTSQGDVLYSFKIMHDKVQ